MDIIGKGFIARYFQRIAESHPNVVLFASGVSQSNCTDDAQFRREADLLYSTIDHCRVHGRTLVYFSTSGDHMYASPDTSGLENEPVFPRSAYGRHKLAMETVIERSRIDYLIIRLAYPVGLNQQMHQLMPSLIRQVKQGYVEIRKGTYRDLIDIEDVVILTHTLLQRGVTRDVINMASGFPVTVDAIVEHLQPQTPQLLLKHYTYGHTGYRVNVEKLKSLVGDSTLLPFDQDYYRRVIDKYAEMADVALG